MTLYLDRKYLLLVSARLRNFAQKETDLFNFSCPFCGDSQKNTRKARGYVYAREDSYFYKCHNCEQSTNFYGFLKFLDPTKHKEYVLEKFKDNIKPHQFTRQDKIAAVADTAPISQVLMLSLYTIECLPEGHYAREYLKARRIPEQFWHEIYYTDKFKTFMDDFFPGHGKEKLPDDPRIVLPYTNFKGDYTHIAGRALESGDKTIRYVVVKLLDEKKAFGLHRLSQDKNERVYITEGQFDSCFLPNAVAPGDSNLLGMATYLDWQGYTNLVCVYDAEPRNKELVKQINETINAGLFVTLLPYDEKSKDLNEKVVNGMTLADLKYLVDSRTYRGLIAKLKFMTWRRV